MPAGVSQTTGVHHEVTERRLFSQRGLPLTASHRASGALRPSRKAVSSAPSGPFCLSRLAVTMLRGLLDGQELATWRVELAATLLVRESTAPAPS